MTKTAVTSRSSYLADGLATPRNIGFPLQSAADLIVKVDGVLQVLNTHYSVTGLLSNPVMTPLTPFWANGAAVRYRRKTPASQQYDAQAGVALSAEGLEATLDRNVMAIQDIEGQVEEYGFSSIRVPEGEEGGVLPTLVDRIGRFLSWNPLGKPIAVTGTGADSALRTDLASADVALGSDILAYRPYGTSAAIRTVRNKLGENVSLLDFGAVGDGDDDFAAIQLACEYIDEVGAGKISVTSSEAGGIYGISETIQLPAGCDLVGAGGSLKVLDETYYDAAIIGIPGADRLSVSNLFIDLNNVPAACGIIMRRNNPEFRVSDLLIINGVHSKAKKGGRALNIEAGVDPAAYGPRNAIITGVVVRDCYEALSISGGVDPQQESNIRADVLAENCQSAIGLFGNTASYPHSPDEMGFHVTMTARNCGKATTYAREHGVINADRACNGKIDIQVMNDDAYGAVGSLWRGDASNIMLNAQMSGNCSRALLDFNSYQELDAVDEDATWTATGNTLSTLVGDFKVKHSGTIAKPINVPISTAAYLENMRFDLQTDIVTSGKPLDSTLSNKINCYGRFQNKTSNAVIEGFFHDIGANVTFANYANREYRASDKGSLKFWVLFNALTMVVANAHNVASVARKGGAPDGTFVITFENAAPHALYMASGHFDPQSFTSSQNLYCPSAEITTAGVVAYTRSGGVLIPAASGPAYVYVEGNW